MNPRSRNILALAAAFSLCSMTQLPALAATVTGKVIDKDTEEGLSKVTLTVLGASRRQETSGKGGTFNLGDLPPGTYSLLVERSGYSPQKLTLTVGEAAKKLEIGLTSKVYEGAEVKVSSQAPTLKRPNVSQTTIGREELKQIPGAMRDPLKAATNMPGVTPAGPMSSAPTVRGGGPSDNAFYLDRFEIGNPFHFGGITSALSSDVVENFNLYTGAFPARYGNATAGIFELESRPPRTDRIGGTLDTNLMWSSLFLEGPLADNLSFSLNGRRSYIDLLIGKMLPDFTAFPRFHDYMGRVQWRPDQRNTITALAFGLDDFMDVKLPASASADSGIDTFRTGQDSSIQGVSWKSSMADWIASELTIARNTYGTHIGIVPQSNLDIDTSILNVREDLSLRVAEGHEMGLGVRYQSANVKIASDFPAPPNPPDAYAGMKWSDIPRIKVDDAYDLGMLSYYVEDKWQAIDPLTLTLGLRQDRMTKTGKSALSPRLGLAYQADDRTTLRLGWGQYYGFLFNEKSSSGFGNPKLDYEHAMHSVAGIERQFGDHLMGKLEIYHKQLDQLAAPDPVANYLNTGAGYTRGVEISSNFKPAGFDLPVLGRIEGVSGQLSYSVSQSKRWDAPGAPIYNYEYSQPHVATLLVDYPLPMGWKGGLKWRYMSGTPYTPYVGRTQNPTTLDWLPVRGVRNSKRLPDTNQLDLRFEHKGAFFWREANYYVDVLNALNQKQVIGYAYETDYSNFNAPTEQAGLPFIPFVGVEYTF